jgi:hypothetical protein
MWTKRLNGAGPVRGQRAHALPTALSLDHMPTAFPPPTEGSRPLNTNPIPELAPQLKQLRLSGILDSLESRNRQAIEGKLAYTEFLAMLVGDEVARRENKKFSMRLRRAQFRTTKTLEQFEFARLPRLNRSLVHDLATGRYLQEKAPVLIVGPQRHRQEPSGAGSGALRGAPGRGRGLHLVRGVDAGPERRACHRHVRRKLAALSGWGC